MVNQSHDNDGKSGSSSNKSNTSSNNNIRSVSSNHLSNDRPKPRLT